MAIQIIDKPEEISAFCLLARKGAFKLELLGMKRRGQSVYSIVKGLYGFTGNKQSVYDQYCQYLRNIGVLVD
jgi:hypothetical protein